jgi:glycosyltransferase involved in cell wall biosynthesis
MSQRPLLTVCIPAYNRAALLGALLDSILAQNFDDYEVLICEDGSPEREAITDVVRKFQELHPDRIRYEENFANLGYDGNIRRLVERAHGRYCVFMGNDDLLCEGALARIAAAVKQQPDCGVVVRSYASFEANPKQPKQVFRYFPQEHLLPAGAQAIFTAYRRSVVISGMVIERDASQAVATDQFDGTLLYQLYLVGMILATHSVVFVPEVIALRRDGTPPDFGNSDVERGKFVPLDQTPESSLHFMRGMMAIARYVEEATRLRVFGAIRADIGNYAYPILSIQAKRSLPVFFAYGVSLARLGLWRYPLFHLYFVTLLLIGPDRADRMIGMIKRRLGYTPRLGAARGGSR